MSLRIENNQAVWVTAKRMYPLSTGFLALVVGVLSYLSAKLGSTLALPSLAVSALWPACAVLVSILLLVPRRTWPALIPAGLAGFFVHDLQIGFPHSTIALYIVSDTLEILIVALGLGYSFEGVPRLHSLKTLAKYSLFAVLGPFVCSLVGAFAIPGRYWVDFRLFFFSETIAFFTITPALLSWISPDSEQDKQSSRSKLEIGTLVGVVVLSTCAIFFFDLSTVPATLIYALVPALLWAALRFGSRGVSTSVTVIAFVSIWGTIHGHGPFMGSDPLRSVLSLQAFLIFAAIPFMTLAAVVEDRASAGLVEKELSRRLISAQEQERIRIARELHDDVCQRLALLSIEIQKASRDENHSATARNQLEEIKQHCSEIAADVQLLSHQLHSAKLDYLGISAAIRGFCRELGKQQEVSVEFTERSVPKSVSRDGSLCLFRVAQEALHNAVKYSGGNRFWVELSGVGKEVRLEVKDAGIGFDVKEASRFGGLGLLSMQERVRAVNGRFYVKSKPGIGTKIIASVPVSDADSMGKAASDDAASVTGAA